MASTEQQKEYARKWYAANRDEQRAKRRSYYLAHKDEWRDWRQAWREANREKHRAYNRANSHKWDNPEVRRQWRDANRDRIRELARARYHGREDLKLKNLEKAARRRRAICAWADKAKVLEIYAEARRLTRRTGVAHVVDHIVPLKHPLVSGLHNEFNLRVITRLENGRKKNKFSPEVAI